MAYCMGKQPERGKCLISVCTEGDKHPGRKQVFVKEIAQMLQPPETLQLEFTFSLDIKHNRPRYMSATLSIPFVGSIAVHRI